MNKRSYLILCILVSSISAFAQDSYDRLSDRYFQLGAGFSLSNFLDNSFSTLPYHGYGASVNAGLMFNKKDLHQHQGDFRFDYGNAVHSLNYGSVTSYRFEGNYHYRRHLRSFLSDHLQWTLGGAINGLWQLWSYNNYSNNAYNNSIYVSLSPSTSLNYDFKLLKRNFQAGFTAFLPLVTFAIRPSYGASSFSGFLDREDEDLLNNALESGKLVTLNRYQRYSNTFFLDYLIKNGNRLRLSYTWNVIRYDDPRLTVSGSHNIAISTLFNF